MEEKKSQEPSSKLYSALLQDGDDVKRTRFTRRENLTEGGFSSRAVQRHQTYLFKDSRQASMKVYTLCYSSVVLLLEPVSKGKW